MHGSGGPLDPHRFDVRRIAQAEIGSQIVVAPKPDAATADLPHLPPHGASIKGLHPCRGTNGRTVGHSADQFYGEPTIAVAVVMVEVVSATITAGSKQVQKPIVVVVRPGHAPRVAILIHR